MTNVWQDRRFAGYVWGGVVCGLIVGFLWPRLTARPPSAPNLDPNGTVSQTER
jgi:hypothetical protein